MYVYLHCRISTVYSTERSVYLRVLRSFTRSHRCVRSAECRAVAPPCGARPTPGSAQRPRRRSARSYAAAGTEYLQGRERICRGWQAFPVRLLFPPWTRAASTHKLSRALAACAAKHCEKLPTATPRSSLHRVSCEVVTGRDVQLSLQKSALRRLLEADERSWQNYEIPLQARARGVLFP